MITNYKRGRSKEYRIMKKLRDSGYQIVFRSAGSHSPIDVVGIKKYEIVFIQSKSKNMSKRAKERLKEKWDWLNNEFIAKFEVK